MDHREIKSEVEYTLDPDGDLWVAFCCPSDSPAAALRTLKSTTRPSLPEKGDNDEETGDVRIKMRVCSNILIMVSPVFRKMLTGWAIEAVDFKASKSSSPSAASIYTLELHEDNAEAAIILFSSLHHCDVDRILLKGAFILEDLALICDKYQCAKALRLRSELLLGERLNILEGWLARAESYPPIINYWIAQAARALILAYVMDLPKIFTTMAWYLFILHRGPFNAENSPAALLVDHPAFGMVDVASYLETRRLEHANLYHKSMMAPFRISWWTRADVGACHSATNALAKYHKFLIETGLIEERLMEDRPMENRLRPDDLLFENHSFRDLLNLSYPVFRVQWCGVTCLNCSNDRVSPISQDLAREVRIVADEIKSKWQEFACLNCLRPDEKRLWTCGACRPHGLKCLPGMREG